MFHLFQIGFAHSPTIHINFIFFGSLK